jgi:predicted ATPase/class 3 adenylate cyclase
MTGPPSGTVTFLFTDIEGSTKLAREHPETWESSRSLHHQILRETIESNHGFVFQIIGDAFCAAFHKAGDALKAAFEAQQHLQSESWGDGVIRVRMGIHTGEAELHNNEYQGYLTLSLVQRIMSAGHGGQILVSNVTENLLRGQLPKDVSLRDMGEHKFKDVPYPVRVFQVLAPGLQKEFPALRVLDESPNNLPTQLTSFIGREKEVADVKRLLANTHLLTLIGPGGTGKTRLSLQVASEVLHAYPHGVWLIELAPISDPSLVSAATLAALGLPAEVHHPAIDMLCDYLHEKEALLILDNCEHLVDACARMVDRLLHAAPKLRILASSREALGIAGEVSYRVPSLELPDVKSLPTVESLNQYEAVRLFIDRAVAALPTFTVTNDNAPAVAQICHRLDGIPLALELAAAKVRALSVEQISKRLDDRFRLLTGGSRTALERHQTLRATLDWSYNLLSEREQVLFRRLSSFINGWTLEAAEFVCSDERIQSDDVFELLEQLVNKSLVVAQDWQHETRYRVLETMRQYANEKLIEAGESETLRDRHLEYFLSLAETAEPHLIRPEQLEWLDRLEAEHENMRAALEWSLGYERPEYALRLTAALGRFWDMHCYWMEGTKWLDRALTKPMANPTLAEKTARAWALIREAILAEGLDDLRKMKDSAESSLALFEASSDSGGIATAKYCIGHSLIRLGLLDRAQSFFEESLAEFQKLNDPYWEMLNQHRLTMILVMKGDKSPSEIIEQNLEQARKVGERLHLADTVYNRAELAWLNHQVNEAERYLAEADALYRDIGHRAMLNPFLRGLAAHVRNEFQEAKTIYTTMRNQLEVIGEQNAKSTAIVYLGMLARDEGNFEQAQFFMEEVLDIQKEMGSGFWFAESRTMLGQIHFLQGNLEDAKHMFHEGISTAKKANNYYEKSNVLLYFCNAYSSLQPKFTLQILGMLHDYYWKQRGLPINPLMKREADSASAKAKQLLSEADFNAAWAQGEKMTIDEAIDLALKTLDEI